MPFLQEWGTVCGPSLHSHSRQTQTTSGHTHCMPGTKQKSLHRNLQRRKVIMYTSNIQLCTSHNIFHRPGRRGGGGGSSMEDGGRADQFFWSYVNNQKYVAKQVKLPMGWKTKSQCYGLVPATAQATSGQTAAGAYASVTELIAVNNIT